jgi:kynureninase
MNYENTLEFAELSDKNDGLNKYREQFIFPVHNGKKAIYLCGNSLGLQPATAKAAINQELDDWGKHGVEGHFMAKHPWVSYHEMFANPLAKLIGAKPNEVVAMNGLTQNLHLLLVSFYRPEGKRIKILYEADAFPSDKYALDSQARFHGLNPSEAIVGLHPREGEYTLRTEDIVNKINELGDELALVMFGGVNYYTGQAFDMRTITEAAHNVCAYAGFDLAHAMGNIKMELHNWDVDFACWCSYKYLNSGPGSVSGIYVHEKHCKNKNIPRFEGWWGHNKQERFKMENTFNPMPTAEAWQLSNAPVFSMAIHKAALDIYEEAGFDALCEKRDTLTGYLEFIINDIANKGANLEIITPANKKDRGCQLSIVAHGMGKALHTKLQEKGVISDWREPNVIRLAPVPLYNSYEDIYRFGQILENAIKETQ